MPARFHTLPRVLIIDDDLPLLESYTVWLEEEFQVYTAPTGEAGLACFQREAIDVLLLDLRLPAMDGIEVLRRVKMIDAAVPVIVVTARDEARAAVEALKLGAVEYLVKPFDLETTLPLLRQALLRPEGSGRALLTPADTAVPRVLEVLVGQSTALHHLASALSRVAETDATVLLTGESGVGKELVARALHHVSPRRGEPFVAVNGAAIPAPLAGSLLFGHERGAFTGATTRQRGAFERAQRGTLLLDEVGGLPPEVQATLLRVLQERRFERVGGQHPLRADVRIVASTNQDLQHLVEAGRFREDLFYRLHVVPLRVPPLRERREDIPLLVRHFLAQYNRVFVRHIPGMTLEALALLGRYAWPGNVRELEHVIARLVATSRPRVLEVTDLPSEILAATPVGS
ncbi:MAG: sigma-54-dependent transcriptional regulator [Candidatus Tectimicrobiota bacterium]